MCNKLSYINRIRVTVFRESQELILLFIKGFVDNGRKLILCLKIRADEFISSQKIDNFGIMVDIGEKVHLVMFFAFQHQLLCMSRDVVLYLFAINIMGVMISGNLRVFEVVTLRSYHKVFLFNFFRPRYKFLLFSNLHEVEVGPHY